MHGFQEWHSTEASGPTSTPNCGCDARWPAEGAGCVSGGGLWRSNRSWVCMNYWTPSVAAAQRPACRLATGSTLDCVANLTEKIVGDDASHIIDKFEVKTTACHVVFHNRWAVYLHQSWAIAADAALQDFVERRGARPFFATLWLHTIHLPRGALPEWFHNYTDSFGDPAGDYLGSL